MFDPEIYANRIVNNIYLSDEKTANNLNYLQHLGIKKIITIGTEVKCVFNDDFEYLHISLYDHPHELIGDYFKTTNKFIDGSSEPVLVHCHMGISRSATIIIAYLMYKYEMSYNVADQFLKARRKIINPNVGFINQLKQYDTLLCLQRYNAHYIPLYKKIIYDH